MFVLKQGSGNKKHKQKTTYVCVFVQLYVSFVHYCQYDSFCCVCGLLGGVELHGVAAGEPLVQPDVLNSFIYIYIYTCIYIYI